MAGGLGARGGRAGRAAGRRLAGIVGVAAPGGPDPRRDPGSGGGSGAGFRPRALRAVDRLRPRRRGDRGGGPKPGPGHPGPPSGPGPGRSIRSSSPSERKPCAASSTNWSNRASPSSSCGPLPRSRRSRTGSRSSTGWPRPCWNSRLEGPSQAGLAYNDQAAADPAPVDTDGRHSSATCRGRGVPLHPVRADDGRRRATAPGRHVVPPVDRRRWRRHDRRRRARHRARRRPAGRGPDAPSGQYRALLGRDRVRLRPGGGRAGLRHRGGGGHGGPGFRRSGRPPGVRPHRRPQPGVDPSG